MNLADYLLGRKPPGGKVLAVGQQTPPFTYGQAALQVDSVAQWLVTGGHRGSMVGLMSENSPFFICSYLGIIKSGNVAVPLPVRAGRRELEEIVGVCGMTLAFCQENAASSLAGLGVEVVGGPQVKGMPKAVDARSLGGGQDDAAVMFTSGSTAKPKGVVLSHNNIISNTDSIIGALGILPTDVQMVVLPFHYCFGTSLLHTHLKAGATLVLNNRFMFPQTVISDLHEFGCTSFSGVPSTYQILLRRSSFKTEKFPKLRYLAQAGGKLADVFIKEIRDAHPEINFVTMYGQTEATARLSVLPPQLLESKFGSIGKGIPGVKLLVLDESGNPVPPGEVGQVVASGPNIMKGYLKDSAETAKVLRNGLLYTGDLATVDSDGFIFIVSRQKHMIKSAGYRISPKEIEQAACQLEGIVDCVAVGEPDDLLGEAVVLYAVKAPQSGLDEGQVVAHCRKVLQTYKVPKRIVFLDALPYTPAGKVDRAMLLKKGA